MCPHIYQTINAGVCPLCGKTTNEVDWAEQNKLYAQWKMDNPNAKYGGWWSI